MNAEEPGVGYFFIFIFIVALVAIVLSVIEFLHKVQIFD